MKIRVFQAVLVSLLLLFSRISLAQEYIVKYKDTASFEASTLGFSILSAGSVVDQHKDGKLVLVDLPEERGSSLIASFGQDPSIEYVVENIKIHAFSNPLTNDPMSDQQWALDKVKASEAWQYTRGDPSIVVAITDTGINWGHEDLKDQIWENPAELEGNGIDDDNNGYIDDIRGWDFFAKDNNPEDETSAGRNPGHGTHCAGIVGAKGNNQVGISGMAQEVTLMPVRFLGADGSGDLMGAVKSIDYAVTNNADIISASWGAAVTREQIAPVLEAIERARDKGIIFVAAASNDGKNNDGYEVYPANAGFDNVITVAASGPTDAKPSWSNYGRGKVDLAAPGENIYSTLPSGYGKLSGTSMATPLVSGLVALVLSYAKQIGVEITPTEVKALLSATGDVVDIETASSRRVNAGAALKALDERKLLLNPFAKTVGVDEAIQLGTMNASDTLAFSVSDKTLADISPEGLLTGKADGQVSVTVKDDTGAEFTSDRFFIGQSEAPPGDDMCPFDDPSMCDIFCQIDPTFPWCP